MKHESLDMENLKAIAVDLDGTILGKGSIMSERTGSALRRCVEADLPVLLCTGRSPAAAEPYRAAIGAVGPMVFYNGAAVVDAPSGPILATTLLDGSVSSFCVALARRMDVHFHGFLKDGSLVYERRRAESATYESRSGLTGRLVDFDSLAAEYGDGFPLIKGMYVADPEVLSLVEKELDAHFGASIYHARSHADFLEIMAAGVSKGAALKVALTLRGIDPAQAAAFGDGENDIPMIEAVGWGIAMGNAVPAVKSVAREVVQSVGDDGVALWIEEHILR